LHTWQLVGKRVIGFIGSFYHYEGLDLLLHAMAPWSAYLRSRLIIGSGVRWSQPLGNSQELRLGNCRDGRAYPP
jgi:hypothetical protein